MKFSIAALVAVCGASIFSTTDAAFVTHSSNNKGAPSRIATSSSTTGQ